jgi:hypothetical protein
VLSVSGRLLGHVSEAARRVKSCVWTGREDSERINNGSVGGGPVMVALSRARRGWNDEALIRGTDRFVSERRETRAKKRRRVRNAHAKATCD